MSTTDDIFLASSGSLESMVAWLSAALRLRSLEDPDLKEGEYLFSADARTGEGEVVFVVEPNGYGSIDPEPEDVSAIDRYTAAVEVRLVSAKDEEAQAAEARAVFDELAAGRPEVAIVLSHNLSGLIAAYLPGAGVRTFPPDTTLDAPDVELWRGWVVC
ncbi:hypothetical protein [Kribbella sp. NPDC049227]|uniref:hypothetical protein n=1 Tax=Kribbella sp. NPDC049227 TaxID=3364113 RepID=UPI003723A43F